MPEKLKAGLAAFVGSPGFVPIEVSGAVRSTVTGTMSVVAWPTESVATASSQYEPSAGSVQETLYGATVGSPSELRDEQSATVQT